MPNLNTIRRVIMSGQATDPDVVAFQQTTGATDISGLDRLAKYLKQQSLWADARFFPFKSAQNIGTGSTVFGLGGWTTNNVTLVNGPTWGTTGVTFDGVDDYGQVSMPGFGSLTNLSRFSRSAPALASAADSLRASQEFFGRSGVSQLWFIGGITGLTVGETITAGPTFSGPTSNRVGCTGFTWTANEDHCSTFLCSASSGYWKNQTQITIDASSGTTSQVSPSFSTWVGDEILVLSAQSGSALGDTSRVGERRVCLLYIRVLVTEDQRARITDLINAL